MGSNPTAAVAVEGGGNEYAGLTFINGGALNDMIGL